MLGRARGGGPRGGAMLNGWGGQQFPHPPGRKPVVGDALSVDRDAPLSSFVRIGHDLGPIFEIAVFRQKFVFVAGAELAAQMCDEKTFRKQLSPALTALRGFAGDGLFTAHSDEPNWSLAHCLLMPAFTKASMQRYHPVMLQTIRELLSYWSAVDGPVDVSRDMTKLTLETLSRAALGRDFASFESAEPHPFVEAMILALRAGQQRAVAETAPGRRQSLARIDKKVAPAEEYVGDLIDDVIATRRRDGDTSTDDLLGLMLHARDPETGEGLDDTNIRYQVLTFLVAGHETTSGALSFTLYYLSRHPEVVRQLQEEVDGVLGPDPDVEPSFEQVAKLRGVRRALDEALRLWPTAPGFGRGPRDASVELSTGHTMTPDDWAIVLLPLVHRDPQVWGDDALAYDPDRFLPDRARSRPAHTYKPFGTGERSCIGRQFALHEAVLVLGTLLHRFDISGDPDYDLSISERLTLMPKGFELTFTPRRPRAADRRPETEAGPETGDGPEADAGNATAASGCPHHGGPSD